MPRLILILLALSCTIGAASAACPPQVSANTADTIRANGQRLLCQQGEIDATTRQRLNEMQRDALQRAQQDQAIRQRLDDLPEIPVYTAPDIPVYTPPGTAFR